MVLSKSRRYLQAALENKETLKWRLNKELTATNWPFKNYEGKFFQEENDKTWKEDTSEQQQKNKNNEICTDRLSVNVIKYLRYKVKFRNGLFGLTFSMV